MRHSAPIPERRFVARRPLAALTSLFVAFSLLVAPGTAGAGTEPATLVVTYRTDDDAGPVEARAQRLGDVETVTPQLDRVVVSVDDVGAARRQLAAVPGVTSVVEDVPVRALNLNSWNLRSRTNTVGAANAYAAHAITTGVGVTVAVIDTGVDANPDLPASRVLTGRNIITNSPGGRDDDGHGTHVAGTVAQQMGDTFGADSVAPGATILPVRSLNSTGSGVASDVATGIVWAVDQGARVLNLSLGAENTTAARNIMCPAVDYAFSNGAVVVAAVGNDGANTALVPAACSNAIRVGAIGPNGTLPAYSNRTPGMLVAPGGAGATFVRQMTINKSDPNWPNPALRTYTVQGKAGTSMAAPHVAGAAALMRSVNPALSPSLLRSLLYTTAFNGPSGYAQLDVAAAVNAARLPRWRATSLDGLGLPAGAGRAVGATVGDHTTTLLFNGAPHVFYTDETNGRLRHAWWTGATWLFEDLDGPGVPGGLGRSANRVGAGASSVLYGGMPHVWYLDDGDKRLRHAWWTGTTWLFEDLDGPGVPGGAGRVDAALSGQTTVTNFGRGPHVWYHDETNGRLRHAWWTGRNWAFEDLDGAGVPGGAGRSAGRVGTDASVVNFQAGPHVFYRDVDAGRLRHGWWTGRIWAFENLEGPGVPGGAGRLASRTGVTTATILFGGLPHVWYQPEDGSALRHAWWTGSFWAFESNDTAAACGVGCAPGTSPSVVLYTGKPHVFHGTGTKGNLRHSFWTGAAWAVQNLDGPGVDPTDGATPSNVGRFPSAVIFAGQPHVFHGSGGLGRLRQSWYS